MVDSIVEPLYSDNFLEVLRAFRGFLLSSLGPCGGLKIIVSEGGLFTLTSSSKRLVQRLVVSHPVCLYIMQVIKSQLAQYGDCGLYTGIMMSSLLECFIISDSRLDIHKLQKSLSSLLSEMLNILDSDYFKVPLDFSSADQLLCVTDNILTSKAAHGLSKPERKSVAIDIVKSFLISLDDKASEIIVVTGDESSVCSKVFEGVLYEVADDDIVLNSLDEKDKHVSIMLFNIMLTYTRKDFMLVEDYNEKVFLNKIKVILQNGLDLGVKIVACQKVIHPSLRLYLERKGVLVLERLGSNLTQTLEKLSGAVGISTIEKYENISTAFGILDCARRVCVNKKTFVLLEKRNTGVATLFVNARGEEATSELKVVVEQSLNILKQLTIKPYVIPGAGCQEICLVFHLQQLKKDCSGLDLECIRILQKCLMISSGLKSISVDTRYYHAWTEKDKCRCGLVLLEDVTSAAEKHITVMNTVTLQNQISEHPINVSSVNNLSRKLHVGVKVDYHSAKRNAISLAIQHCCDVLQIGTVVLRKPQC